MGGRKYGKKKSKPTGWHPMPSGTVPTVEGPTRFELGPVPSSGSISGILSVSKMLGCEQVNAKLPKSTWVLHSGDTHITNDRSLLISASACDEYLYGNVGGKMKAEAIGDVYLELANNLVLPLKRVRYVPTVRYNLLSDRILQHEMGFQIEFDKVKTHLCFKERDGGETRFEAINMVACKFVFLTKEPTIDYVNEYAAAHPTPNQSDFLSTYTQDSPIGRNARMREAIENITSGKIGSHRVETL